jgi:hypothetical protein
MTCYIKYKDNLSIMPVSKTNIIIDSDILDKDILYKQIAKTYYFNQEPPQFSDIHWIYEQLSKFIQYVLDSKNGC